MRKATNILWDVDDDDAEVAVEEILAQLPTEIEIPNEIADDEIADYLSEQTGYCHFGFKVNNVQVLCTNSFVEDGVEYWREGKRYNVIARDDDFGGWCIEHDFGEGIIYDDDFEEYFEFIE